MVGSGAIPISSHLNNLTDDDSQAEIIETNDENSIVTFSNEPTLYSNKEYEIETVIEMQVNYINGDPVPNNTVINIETTLSGTVDGAFQQSISSEGIENRS